MVTEYGKVTEETKQTGGAPLIDNLKTGRF
jgi:hypothetical protein